MRPADIDVQVRNKALGIIGPIPSDELNFMLHKMFANVGLWSVKLPIEHPMVAQLNTAGAGVVVSLEGKVIASGPVTNPVIRQNADDPLGMVEFRGVTDSIHIEDAVCYPDPDNLARSQAKVHDRQTGACETLMHHYVNKNIGPGALADRRRANLVMGTDGGRGKTVTRKPRFKNLGAVVTSLARAGRLGFEIIQVGSNLEFRTYPTRDRTATMVLDVQDDSISSSEMSYDPVPATNVIVGGRGHGVKRKFRDVATAESNTLSDDWGRRVEVYMDYRGADETPEGTDLIAAGEDWLDDELDSPIQLRITPSEYADKRYGKDWELGDKVTVMVAGNAKQVRATGLIIKVDEKGARYGVTFGDPTMQHGSNAGMGFKNPKKHRPKGKAESADEILSDLSTESPDLTEYTLDGVDWAVENRVLLINNGATVPADTHYGTIIFEKAV